MSRALHRCCAVAGLLAGVACGDTTYIILEVQSDLAIPEQTNRLELGVYPYGGSEPLSTWSVDLDPTAAFPLDVGILPSDDAPTGMDARVEAWLDDSAVAYVLAAFEWQRGVITRVTMPPLDPGG